MRIGREMRKANRTRPFSLGTRGSLHSYAATKDAVIQFTRVIALQYTRSADTRELDLPGMMNTTDGPRPGVIAAHGASAEGMVASVTSNVRWADERCLGCRVRGSVPRIRRGLMRHTPILLLLEDCRPNVSAPARPRRREVLRVKSGRQNFHGPTDTWPYVVRSQQQEVSPLPNGRMLISWFLRSDQN